MKMKFLAMGLLGAAIATTAVWADDTSNSSAAQTPAMSGQQAPAPSQAPAPAQAPSNSTTTTPPATQSGNGQVTN